MFPTLKHNHLKMLTFSFQGGARMSVVNFCYVPLYETYYTLDLDLNLNVGVWFSSLLQVPIIPSARSPATKKEPIQMLTCTLPCMERKVILASGSCHLSNMLEESEYGR